MGGTGSYIFDSSRGIGITCFAANTGVPIEKLAVTSVGTFSNVMCGTGEAHSTSNAVISSNPVSLWYTTDFPYDITFVGGYGLLVFRPGSGVTGGGPITITDPTPSVPSPPGDPNADCTSDFKVTGTIQATFG
jgi:hypothetical protein